MTLSDLLSKLNKHAVIDVSDCHSLNIRCTPAEVPEELLLRCVEYLSPEAIGGVHLRIILDDPALYY